MTLKMKKEYCEDLEDENHDFILYVPKRVPTIKWIKDADSLD